MTSLHSLCHGGVTDCMTMINKAALQIYCVLLVATAGCKSPIDIRDTPGVHTDKLAGSRVEYDPFPAGFRITPGLSIHIEFKTVYPVGLLMLSGNFKKGDIVAAYLSNGRLIFARKCGYGRVFEIYNKPLNDGLWHKATFIHSTRGGKLLIDGHNPFREYHMGSCSPFTSVLFGGLSPHLEVNRMKGNDVYHRFKGCMRNMRIDHRIPSLHPKYYAVSQCDVDDDEDL